jgi:NADPH:quinone reductase-like Zn-dependent oxidoreductase
MKAVRIHEFGGLEVLQYEDVERPKPKQGQLLVRVGAAGVGVWEIDIREGGWQDFMPYDLPLIIGTDMAGIVEAVGPKVKEFRVGDEVYGVADMTLSGAYAQYALTTRDSIARKPKKLNFVQAASVPVSAVTAWLMLYDLGNLKSKQKVIIHGAAGAVGSYAVQLAKLKRAYVIATGSKEDKRFVRSLGADEFIDYHTQQFEDIAEDVDLVIDLVGGKTRRQSYSVIKPGGTLITAPEQLDSTDKKLAKKHRVRIDFVECVPTKELLQKIAKLIDSGKLKVNVGDVLPLREARKAQKLLEQHKAARGKLVLKVA